MTTTDEASRTIWSYMRLEQPLKKADALFVLCSHDTRVADRAVQLYQEGLAQTIIFSGGVIVTFWGGKF